MPSFTTLLVTTCVRSVSDCMFLCLSQARLGSCVLDCVSLLLSLSQPDTRQRLVSLVHEVYYQAFATAVAHIDPQVEMFTREDFKKEVTRLAVYCGLLALQAARDSGENFYTKIFHNINPRL